MASTLNASTSAGGGLISSADASGILQLQTANVAALTIDASQNVSTVNNINVPNTFGFKNRIINGAMMIDQRNAGASVTPTSTNTYTLDRWVAQLSAASKYSVQQSSTAPAGFINSMLVTSLAATSVGSTDYYAMRQMIEGLNVGDFAWGTASAAPITISFWVRSSLTGTFGGVVSNNAENRTHPFTYTISAANTFEYKTVTIAGDTSGTWLTTNGTGLRLIFGLGVGSTYSGTAGSWSGNLYLSATGATSVVGTSGATFYITGVQLEKGSTATSFDYRPYGTELALCQRYYYKFSCDTGAAFGGSFNNSTTLAIGAFSFPVTMRTAPTSLEQTGTAGNYGVDIAGNTLSCSAVPSFAAAGTNSGKVFFTVASGLTAGQGSLIMSRATGSYLGFPAEL